MVLTLAMLLAVTSSIVWWTARPLMAANIPRIMVIGSSLADRFPVGSGWWPVPVWWLVDDRAVDVGEDAVAHVVGADGGDHGAVLNRDHEGRRVDEDEGVTRPLGRCLGDAFAEPCHGGRVDGDAPLLQPLHRVSAEAQRVGV